MTRLRAAWLGCLSVLAFSVAGAPALARGQAAAPSAQPLSIVLPLVADDGGLRRFTQAVSTPGSPQYGHYASIAELARRFGARPTTTAAVQRYLRARGGRDVQVSPTDMYVQATMTVADAQRTFGVNLALVHAADGARYVAPTSASAAAAGRRAVPAALRGLATGVVGLDTRSVVTQPDLEHLPMSRASAHAAAGPPPSAYLPRTGTATGCASGVAARGFSPSQYLSAYGYTALHSAGLQGGGERAALIEINGFKTSDVDAFGRCFGLHVPQIRAFGVGLERPLAPGGETTLDLEVLTAAAPRLKSIDVYENENNAARVLQAFTAPLVEPGAMPQVISASLGICEPYLFAALGPAGIVAVERDFQLAASAGISVLAAAGDNGSSTCQLKDGSPLPKLEVSYPASSAFVTAVGGTNIKLSATNQITDERVWNDSSLGASAGGGGFSELFGRPSYQKGVSPLNARELPDVSLLADLAPGYAIYCTAHGDSVCSGWTSVGGTSAAAPLLAGGIALVDQDLARHHRAFVGLANPLLYKLAGSSARPLVFRDITQYDNDLGAFLPDGNGRALGCCAANAGFDAASGWGSVNLTAFDGAAIAAQPFAPHVALALPRGQRPVAARGVNARLSCSTACRGFVTGEIVTGSDTAVPVRSGSRRLGRAETISIKVPFSRADERKIAAALRAHHRVFAELFGVAVDAQGRALKVTSAVVLHFSR